MQLTFFIQLGLDGRIWEIMYDMSRMLKSKKWLCGVLKHMDRLIIRIKAIEYKKIPSTIYLPKLSFWSGFSGNTIKSILQA